MSTLVGLLSKNCVCALVILTLLNSTSPSSKGRVSVYFLPYVFLKSVFLGVVTAYGRYLRAWKSSFRTV